METINCVVAQKDKILTLIGAATDSTELFQAVWLIHFTADVFTSLGYAYKTAELKKAATARALVLIRENAEYLLHLRKNDKTRRSTEADSDRLAIIASMS